jgi:hypothetical protein
MGLPGMARADDDPVFHIEIRDGLTTPNKLEVPKGKRIVLEVHNAGSTPAEFESHSLRKETVVAPGTTSALVIRELDAGEYDFFDDFHPDQPKSVLIAK